MHAMREKVPRSIQKCACGAGLKCACGAGLKCACGAGLKWISRTDDMSPGALARMFQSDRRTIDAWMRGGRITLRNGTRIRSSFTYLATLRDPLDLRGSGAGI